jgi:DNA-binding GntR family transcriptional regulator
MTGIPMAFSSRKKLAPLESAPGLSASGFHPLSGERLTVSERVYYDFRRSIANGEFRPGQPLIVRNMAAVFKVSRTPVIEAIRRLERDGLVKVAPKWGAIVKEWHWDEIEEAVYIRRALESEAAWLFVERATSEAKEGLTKLNDVFNQCASNDNMVGRQDADIELHLHIARSTRFPRLYELVENSSIERIAIVGLATKRAQEKESTGNDLGAHDVLIQELLGQDPEAARVAMVAHVDDSFGYIAGANKPKSPESPGTTSI